MRIIEPKKTEHDKRRFSHNRSLPLLAVIIVVVSVVAARSQTVKAPEGVSSNAATTEPAAIAEVKENATLKEFTGEELKIFMDNFAYPNVSEVTTKPVITGNSVADERIRQLAESRGYRQRAIPNTSLIRVEGELLQQKAVDPWKELKRNAEAAGLKLDISSGFRPVDEQRQIFNERLAQAGATNSSIAAGKADALVTSVLKTTAVPGYSKHHTGYTIDLTCDGVGLHAFIRTPCYAWLTAKNHENAKLSGWIPSYPSGASLQGPDPEPWEYVWVGTESLYE